MRSFATSITQALSAIVPLVPLVLISCGGGETAPIDGPTTGPTYHADVAPLLNDHCNRCHQAGSIAPFTLTSYADAKAMAGLIAKVTADRTMPPTNVDQGGDCQTFKDSNWLSDAQIQKLAAWAEGGAVEGTPPAKAPLPPAVEHVGANAISMTMAEAYTPVSDPAHPADDYRCFFLDPGITTDQYMSGFEIIPGEASEVHHMLLYSVLTPEDEQKGEALDAADPGPGWSCFGDGGVGSINLLAVWAPGKDVVRYPEGTGIRIAGGRKLVMQIHYNLLAGTKPDKTTVKIETTPTVKKEAVLAPLSDDDLSLPPNMERATAGKTLPLLLLGIPEIELHGVFPHMHLLGQTQNYTVYDTGSDPAEGTCLMDVPKWNFHWQQLFFYEKSLILNSAQSIKFECGYDTRGQTKTVTYGEGTQDEMCIVFSYLTLPQGGPLPQF